jgi:hypothetical protein
VKVLNVPQFAPESEIITANKLLFERDEVWKSSTNTP